MKSRDVYHSVTEVYKKQYKQFKVIFGYYQNRKTEMREKKKGDKGRDKGKKEEWEGRTKQEVQQINIE